MLNSAPQGDEISVIRAVEAGPRCDRVASHEQMQCYSPDKSPADITTFSSHSVACRQLLSPIVPRILMAGQGFEARSTYGVQSRYIARVNISKRFLRPSIRLLMPGRARLHPKRHYLHRGASRLPSALDRRQTVSRSRGFGEEDGVLGVGSW